MKTAAFLMTACALISCGASAATYTFDGDTSTGKTFVNPAEARTTVKYSAFSFTVTKSGSYEFFSTANFNDYVLFYTGSFDPTSPDKNLYGGSNEADGNTNKASFVDVPLKVGITYTLVTTAPRGRFEGTFTDTITGPGTVIPTFAVSAVPEPESLAMLVSGLGLVFSVVRRRRPTRA